MYIFTQKDILILIYQKHHKHDSNGNTMWGRMIQGSERTISGVGLCHSIRVMQDDVMGLRDTVMIALL